MEKAEKSKLYSIYLGRSTTENVEYENMAQIRGTVFSKSKIFTNETGSF